MTTATAKTYFVLQASGDDKPYALAALNGDGLPERFVPGKGFLDWPPLAPALLGYGSDAREVRPVSEDEAKALMEQNIGPLPDSYVASQQGKPDGNPDAEPLDPDPEADAPE